MLRKSRYVIAVHDLERSARYYRDVLGFEVRTLSEPGWRFFVRDECFIMAGECRDALSPEKLGDHSYFAYVELDGMEGFQADCATSRGECGSSASGPSTAIGSCSRPASGQKMKG